MAKGLGCQPFQRGSGWLIPQQLILHDAVSSTITQKFLLTGGAIIMPLTLIYHTQAFWLFHGNVK